MLVAIVAGTGFLGETAAPTGTVAAPTATVATTTATVAAPALRSVIFIFFP